MRVAIIGAGPTGLTAANLLGQAGIETLLIERNARLSADPRAITIDDEGLRICQALGLIDEVSAHAQFDVEAHYVSQRKYLIKVTPSHHSYGYPQISTFHQPDLEDILYKGLARFPCVTVRFGHTVVAIGQTSEGVTLDLLTDENGRQTLTCKYVLACDGGRSSIRHLTGIALHPPDMRNLTAASERTFVSQIRKRHTDHTQRWLVVDSINASENSSPIIFFCNPARPAVTVPSPAGRRRWEFLLKPHEHAKQFLNADTISLLIKQASATLPAENHSLDQAYLAPITRQAVYTFHATVAETFSRGRVFLLGDAAHLMPPFGGQGMNSGLRDAYNLCWKLQLVLQKKAHPQLLTTYQHERLPHITQMIFFSSILGAIIMPTQHPLAYIRDITIKSLTSIGHLRRRLTEMNVKPQPKYRRGILLSRQLTSATAQTGQLICQPFVQTIQGEQVRLDQILGNRFSLLKLYEKEKQPFVSAQAEIWTHLNTQFILILSAEEAKPSRLTRLENHPQKSIKVIIDNEGQLRHLLQHNPNAFLLLRPDHYIMGIFHTASMRNVERQLANFFSDSRL